jgi:hypothetical protein
MAAFRALPVGTRVVVRYRTPLGATDVLGPLLHISDTQCEVRSRTGDVTIELASVIAAKQVPPPPRPRRPAAE